MPSIAPGRIASDKIGPWKGMNEKVSPDTLPPNVAANIQNFLLDEVPGTIVKRQGSIALTALPSGLPPRDSYVFTKLDGTSYLLISDGQNLYYTTDPSGAFPAAIKTGLNADGFMEFETAENKVWMTNGIDGVMSWDGTTLLVYDRTRTVTNASSAVTATTITNADLTEADDYWNGMLLVFTSGANIGKVVTITDFVAATDTLTFTPAVAGILVGDDFIVGVSIPKGQAVRYYDGHLFVGCTADNQAELRFHEISDPDTGALMTIGNPRAWPAANELALNVLDQERLFGITPILRDRIMVHKASGLFRLERDPLVKYRLEVVSRTVGSRFPDTWAEKNNILYFLGQDKDGLPEIYKTDMVDVSPVDPDGGIEPTLRGLQQPNAVFSNRTFTSKDDFDSGEKSTGTGTDNGALEVLGYYERALWQTYKSRATVSVGAADGSVFLAGIPPWEVRYDASILASAATPAWTALFGGTGGASLSGTGSVALGPSGGGPGYASYVRDGILSSGQDSMVAMKVSQNTGGTWCLGLANGARSIAYYVVGAALRRLSGSDITDTTIPVDTVGNAQTIMLLLRANGTYKLWIDGLLVDSGTAGASTTNRIIWGLAALSGGDPTSLVPNSQVAGSIANFDSLYYHTNVGDADQIPDTIPTTGNIVVQFDYTRVPDAYRKLYSLVNYPGKYAVCGVTAASLTVQLATDADMSQLVAGVVVDLRTMATGVVIANGTAQTIASVDTVNKTITFTAAVGVVTTTTAMGVYLSGFGAAAVAMTSWSSDTEDFSSGNDGAGYVAVALGAVPTSVVKRYHRVTLAFTRADLLNAPEVTRLMSGMLWVSPAISLGAKISAWRSFLDTITTPAGVDQTIKVRRATTVATPVEADYGAWFVIVNGNNIGTVLGDATPPTSRWLQIKVEQGVSAAGLLPIIDAMVVQWTEGSVGNLPVRGVVHKKRYMVTAATDGATANDIIIVCDRNDQWTKFSGLALNALLHYKGNLYGMDAGDAKVSHLDVDGVYNDAGVAIDAFLETREEDMGAGHLRKNFRFSYLEWDRASAAWTITTYYRRPGDAAYTGSGTFNFGTVGQDVRQNFPIATVGKRIQRKYRNAVLDENVAFMNEVFFFDIRPVQP